MEPYGEGAVPGRIGKSQTSNSAGTQERTEDRPVEPRSGALFLFGLTELARIPGGAPRTRTRQIPGVSVSV